MPSARSLANLKPFKKGKSGNPSGRAKNTEGECPTLKDWQEFALEEPTEAAGKPYKTRDEAIMRTLYMICINARHRDVVRAIVVWLDRTRGKTPDKINLSGKLDVETEENPITTVLEQLLAKAKRVEQVKEAAEEAEAEAAESA